MSSLKYLNKYFVKYKWHLLLGVVFIILTNIFGVYTPMILGEALDGMDSAISDANGEYSETWFTTIIMPIALVAGLTYLLIYLIKGLFLFFTRMSIIVMSRHIEYDLKNEIFNQYQQLDLGFYKRNQTGDLMNRISEDVSRVRMYLGPGVMYTINLSILFVICITYMVSIHPMLTLYALAPLPLMSLLIYFVSSIMNKKAEKVQKQQSKISSLVQEAFSGIRVLKAYNRLDSSIDNFDQNTRDYKKRIMDEVRVNALFMPIIVLLIGLSTTITIYIGGTYHIEDPTSISKGDILVFVMYINMLTWPFAAVGWVTSLVQRAAASQTRINEFLERKPEISDVGPLNDPITGKIEFENVSFTYPDTGIQALKNISFAIETGKTLAIIGRTGSGKSTITQLISRQYDVDSGLIKVDSNPIKEYKLDHLRDNLGYVPQDVFLFSDSLSNNIAFGDTDSKATSKEIEQAAKDAAIYDNIVQFKEGFDTVIGERGVTLSGGQKQRVSIARALLSAPNVLVFDDCLSAVDTETEEEILGNLRRIMANKTTILISHRVSTVKDADHIIVLDQGQIVEEGSHDNLLETKGVYAELYHKQLLEEAEINKP